MEFSVRLHRHTDDLILAVCDIEILGKTFRADGLRLEVHEGFYGGDTISEEEYRRALRNASVVNITGNAAVAIAIEEGLIDPSSVIEVDGVKHAQAVRM